MSFCLEEACHLDVANTSMLVFSNNFSDCVNFEKKRFQGSVKEYHLYKRQSLLSSLMTRIMAVTPITKDSNKEKAHIFI